jgi:hypothetical protein
MPRIDQPVPFIGPSYVSRSLNVDAQRSINLFPEIVESKDGKNSYYLLGTPGLRVFTSLPTTPLRGTYQMLGRCFAVSGDKLYEIFRNGTYSERGTLFTSVNPVGIADNGLQLVIVDGYNQYNLTVETNQFAQNPNGANFPGARTCAFLDGYIIFPKMDSAEFVLTGLFAAGTIDPLDTATKEGASDYIVTVLNLHRQLIIFGEQTIEVWYNAGSGVDNTLFPLAPIQGVFVETGCAAPFSVAKMDNTAFWVGRDPRGQGVVYMLQGFTPVRVSTHPIENILQEMGDLSVLTAYTYQEEGHSFYALNNRNARTTLVYDSACQLWHERQYNDPRTGEATRHLGDFYVFAFGMHLLGDFENGIIYESSLDLLTDFGNPIHRTRTAPHITDALRRTFYDFFQVDVEAGVGLDGNPVGALEVAPVGALLLEDGTGRIVQESSAGDILFEEASEIVYAGPQMMMQYSDDGAHTWSGERWKSIGKIGQYKARAYWNRLGVGRDRVFKVKVTDPVKVVMIDAKIGATGGRF